MFSGHIMFFVSYTMCVVATCTSYVHYRERPPNIGHKLTQTEAVTETAASVTVPPKGEAVAVRLSGLP